VNYPFTKAKQKEKETCHVTYSIKGERALCTAALLPELQPAPCFLSAIIGHTD